MSEFGGRGGGGPSHSPPSKKLKVDTIVVPRSRPLLRATSLLQAPSVRYTIQVNVDEGWKVVYEEKLVARQLQILDGSHPLDLNLIVGDKKNSLLIALPGHYVAKSSPALQPSKSFAALASQLEKAVRRGFGDVAWQAAEGMQPILKERSAHHLYNTTYRPRLKGLHQLFWRMCVMAFEDVQPWNCADDDQQTLSIGVLAVLVVLAGESTFFPSEHLLRKLRATLDMMAALPWEPWKGIYLKKGDKPEQFLVGNNPYLKGHLVDPKVDDIRAGLVLLLSTDCGEGMSQVDRAMLQTALLQANANLMKLQLCDRSKLQRVGTAQEVLLRKEDQHTDHSMLIIVQAEALHLHGPDDEWSLPQVAMEGVWPSSSVNWRNKTNLPLPPMHLQRAITRVQQWMVEGNDLSALPQDALGGTLVEPDDSSDEEDDDDELPYGWMRVVRAALGVRGEQQGAWMMGKGLFLHRLLSCASQGQARGRTMFEVPEEVWKAQTIHPSVWRRVQQLLKEHDPSSGEIKVADVSREGKRERWGKPVDAYEGVALRVLHCLCVLYPGAMRAKELRVFERVEGVGEAWNSMLQAPAHSQGDGAPSGGPYEHDDDDDV